MRTQIEVRDASADDTALIFRFVKELAAYERAPEAVIATEEDIRHSLFGEDVIVHAVICEVNDVPVGFAVYSFNYSTTSGSAITWPTTRWTVSPAASDRDRVMSRGCRVNVGWNSGCCRVRSGCWIGEWRCLRNGMNK